MDTLETAHATHAADGAPSRETLIARAGSLAPALLARAAEAEDARRVSAEAIEEIRSLGIFKILQPRRYGGLEYDFSTLTEISIALGAGCASTAWCANLGIVHNWLLAQFPIEAQDEVHADDPGVLICGSYAPSGACRAVDGGWRVSGSWSFASNVDNSGWALIGVFFPPEDGGETPAPGFALAPEGDYRVHDDWRTVGLAATGSKDVVCEEAFVPSHRRVTFAELTSGNAPGRRVNAAPIYGIPMMACLPAAICTPALGALKGAIDAFVEDVGGRETRGAVVMGGGRMAGFAHVQSRLGEAQAHFNAARSLILSDLRETEAMAAAGAPIDVERRIRNRLSQAFIVKLACEGIDALYAATGGPGLHLFDRVQRAWRDIHAVAHHISLNWDAVSSMYGQMAFGLEPRGQY